MESVCRIAFRISCKLWIVLCNEADIAAMEESDGGEQYERNNHVLIDINTLPHFFDQLSLANNKPDISFIFCEGGELLVFVLIKYLVASLSMVAVF